MYTCGIQSYQYLGTRRENAMLIYLGTMVKIRWPWLEEQDEHVRVLASSNEDV